MKEEKYPKHCHDPSSYMSKRNGDKQILFPKLPDQDLNIDWDKVLTKARKKALMITHDPNGPGRRWNK